MGNSTSDTLEVGALRVQILRRGAEMLSLERRNSDGSWRGFLHRDGVASKPVSGWANHATVMGYFTHRLLGERASFAGREIRAGNHGFVRHFLFDAPVRSETSLTYRVPASKVPEEAYPLPVSMDLTYEIADGCLLVEFCFGNESNETAFLSFGLHPGFAVSSLKGATLEMPKGTYLRYDAPGNFLSGRVDAIEHDGGPMPFSVEDLPGSFLLGLEGVLDRVFRLEDEASGRVVTLDYREVPFVTIWSDGSDFLCVEPCWGLPDSNPQLPFEQKIGIQRIAPGGMLRASFSLEPGFI